MQAGNVGARASHWIDAHAGVVALVLWGVALLVRGACLWHLPASALRGLLLDEAHYHAEAWNIVDGIPSPADSYFMTPLYPLFLSLIFRVAGDDLRAVQGVQMLLGSLVVPAGFMVARRIMGPLASCAAALALSTSGVLLDGEAQVLVEWLIALCVTAAAWLALRSRASRWPAAFCGACAGIATLARGSNLVLALPLVIWFAWLDRAGAGQRPSRRRAPRWVAFVLGFVAVLTPLLVRNAIHAHQPFLLTANAGLNFYVGNGPEATGVFKLPQGLDLEQDPMALRFVQRETSKAVTASESSSFWMQRTLDWVRQHPGHFVRLLAWKAFLFWNQFSFPQLEHTALRREIGAHAPVWWTNAVIPLALAAIGAIGMAVLRRRGLGPVHAEHVLLAGLALAYCASIVAFFITDRYRLGIHPVLLVLAAWVLRELVLAVTRRRFRRAAGLGLWLLVMFTLTSPVDASTPLGQWIPERRRIDATRLRVDARVHDAVRYAAAGDMPQAIQLYEQALRLDPRNPELRAGLARMLSRAKQDDLARDQLRAVVAEHPSFSRGWFNLGNVYRRLGQHEAAIAAYRTSIELEPRREAAWNNLGEAFRALGDTLHAAQAYRQAVAIVPRYEQALNNLAALRGAAGDAAGAEAGFRAAIDANPRYVPACVNLAVLLTNRGRLNEAHEVWRRVVLLDPGNATARENLARVEQALAR